ncbi:hypothetical protein A6770_28010 [Nostoc minutum NIES-26]|uniref:DUF4870 domain-containing protein n=1 Tax=Nostoc minutum NIES-26 TaxID=1844469 RepID=A0A367QLX9_9NOSO|nr:hypothetical protein A6770_28010 [Nostoc minutum NIES-26]
MRKKHKQQMRIWAMLCHISALLAWILLFSLVFLGIPLYLPLNIIAPLLIWRFKKSKYPWIDFQGKESLNFQISLTLYILILIIISLVIVLASFGIAVITNGAVDIKTILNGLLLVWMGLIVILMLFQSLLGILAANKAYKGEHYRYPLTIRFLS